MKHNLQIQIENYTKKCQLSWVINHYSAYKQISPEKRGLRLMREQCVTIRCQLNDRDDKDTVNNDDNEDIRNATDF